MSAPVIEEPSYHLIEEGNWIAGTHWSGLHHAGVKSAERPTRGGWVARIYFCVVYRFLNSRSVDAELAAWGAHGGELDDGLADAPALAAAPLRAIDADSGDIFSERARIQRIAERGQFGDRFGGDYEDRLLRSTVNFGVGASVSGDAEGSDVSLRYGAFGHATAGDADL